MGRSPAWAGSALGADRKDVERQACERNPQQTPRSTSTKSRRRHRGRRRRSHHAGNLTIVHFRGAAHHGGCRKPLQPRLQSSRQQRRPERLRTQQPQQPKPQRIGANGCGGGSHGRSHASASEDAGERGDPPRLPAEQQGYHERPTRSGDADVRQSGGAEGHHLHQEEPKLILHNIRSLISNADDATALLHHRLEHLETNNLANLEAEMSAIGGRIYHEGSRRRRPSEGDAAEGCSRAGLEVIERLALQGYEPPVLAFHSAHTFQTSRFGHTTPYFPRCISAKISALACLVPCSVSQ